MADNIFDASAEPICFTDAIISELADGIEQIPLPPAANITHKSSDIVSDALIAEMEQNAENGTMSRFDLAIKCERFVAKLVDFKLSDGEKGKILLTAPEIFSDDDEELKPKSLVAKLVAKRGGVRKKVLRSMPSNRKRNYVWKQPHKNKARLYKRLQAAEGESAREKRETATTYLKRDRDVLDDGNDVNSLFDETGEEEIEIPDMEYESQDDKEIDEEDLFVSARTLPPTTRQLAVVVRKNMDELYYLSEITPAKPESVRGYEFALRQAVDKVRYGDAGDLTPEEILTLHEAVAQIECNNLAVDF